MSTTGVHRQPTHVNDPVVVTDDTSPINDPVHRPGSPDQGSTTHPGTTHGTTHGTHPNLPPQHGDFEKRHPDARDAKSRRKRLLTKCCLALLTLALLTLALVLAWYLTRKHYKKPHHCEDCPKVLAKCETMCVLTCYQPMEQAFYLDRFCDEECPKVEDVPQNCAMVTFPQHEDHDSRTSGVAVDGNFDYDLAAGLSQRVVQDPTLSWIVPAPY